MNKDDTVYTNRNNDNWYCTSCTSDLFPYNHISDDEEYMLILSDLWDLPIALPYELLHNENNIFSPFELNEDFDNPLSEVDPDLQYYNSQCNTVLNSCDYYLEDGFNDQIKKT